MKRHVVMLFQPVTLQCQYQTSDTNPPLITWKYKSFCRDPIEMALSPSSSDNALAQSNPNYDPVTECPDIQRTVLIVASKRISVTLAAEYQGRKISIINSECILLSMLLQNPLLPISVCFVSWFENIVF